MGIIKYMAMK